MSGMEEPSGTGSSGSSRDPPSAGAGIPSGPRRQPHLTNHIDAAISRSLDARSMARRASRSSERVELRPDPRDRSRGHLLERSDHRLALRSSWAVAWPARDSFGLLVDGQSRPIWASLVRVADHVRAGMEVMSTEGRTL